jgi:chaperonin GroEL
LRGDVRIVNTESVREKVLKGAKVVHDAVKVAYGATSGNVALEKSYGSYIISHDGVSIARDIILEDKEEDIGADLLIQASKKTNDIAGDGTTCSVLLGYRIMEKAHQLIAAGFDPMSIRRGIEKASLEIKSQLDNIAIPVKDEELVNVASISASDPEIGKLVADTILKVGGVGITIEEYEGLGVIQDVVEGLYFEKGWSLEHFVTDVVSQEAIQENVSILALEKRISSNKDIIPLLEMIYKDTDHHTVLFVGNISGQALETCALTQVHPQGKIKVCVVAPPVYGDQMLPFLEDVAAITGGKVIPSSMPADKVTVDYAGTARKIIVAKNETTILEGGGIQEDINLRIDTIKKQLLTDKYSAFQKERMEKRLSKLQGKIGIIRVGGATEAEVKEMKFRVEDALHATRAAKEEGIVAGGAVTLATLPEVTVEADNDSEAQGYSVVYKALREPFKQLMANAGEDGGYRYNQLVDAPVGFGFDAKNMTKEPIDLMKIGITDPVKVLKSIVENACSVAGIAITLQGSVIIDRDYQLEQVQLTKAGMQ